MASTILTRRTASTVVKRFRTTAAYNRRQSSTGWAAGADGSQLKLSAMATAVA
ncbi:hypothetical protein HUG10_07725 [Halorarum halophilum]|uniref:Uncharacterized protein n=1 Tax=Halorarum halophilum TaxID=2743090 RepID=A0A7D5GKF4_9EURY|nr:hypothetical protein [Halobaculum halophilum]QLG27444.1 hypothetical protein HUG10_07725 [Halobaculum halophilum]